VKAFATRPRSRLWSGSSNCSIVGTNFSSIPSTTRKKGLPHFVDFGQNMRYSPDGKAYLVSQGAAEPDPKPRDANLSWITGDQVHLARVTPAITNMNLKRAYEYFAGHDSNGRSLRTRDISNMAPLVDWNNNMRYVSVT
jgi:hypothetical protein